MSLELAKYSDKVDYEFYTIDHRTNNAIDEERLQKAIQQMFSAPADPKDDGMKLSIEEYIKYKKRYVKNLQFDPDIQNLSKLFFSQHLCSKRYLFPAVMIEHGPLQSVYVYFDTATFDEIERDVKVILRDDVRVIMIICAVM